MKQNHVTRLLIAMLCSPLITGCLDEGETTDEAIDEVEEEEEVVSTTEQEVRTPKYVGVFGGYPTYCLPATSTTGCKGHQTKSGSTFVDPRGNRCRYTYWRDGTAVFATKKFITSSTWYKTAVIDCR